jgi:DNA-binding NtrC family response regulator
MRSFLVVCREKQLFDTLRSSLDATSTVDHALTKAGAVEMLNRRRYDAIFMDMALLRESMPRNGYKGALQPFWHVYPAVEIVVMASQEMIREAVMAVKAGAANYLTYPIDPDEVRHVIGNIYQAIIVQSELEYLRDQFWRSDCLELVQTTSPVMEKIFTKVRSVAPTRSTVLLVGETGTGKGVLARLIHQHSNRKDAQFISVHCGAIPDTLLESELFGHEKGAFTGAVRRKLGKFEIAKGGTIFLDEIGTVTPSAQIKLLQVLQDGTFGRVGGQETFQANARIVAATNMNLRNMCNEGRFRKDLYYRLNVFPLEVPPLRERKEDIPHIIEVILQRLNRFHLKEIHDIHPDVLEAFMHYDWPGNIRELENLLERACIIENSSMLTPEAFPSELFPSISSQEGVPLDSSRPPGGSEAQGPGRYRTALSQRAPQPQQR